MITQKKYLNLIVLFVALITGVLFLPGLSYADLTVTENYYFGEVDVGDQRFATLNIDTNSENPVSLIALRLLENDCVFSIISEVSEFEDKTLPKNIVIKYEPSEEGSCTRSLSIWTSDGMAIVNLTGTGVPVQTQEITIDGILFFFDRCVADGTLEGYVPDKSDKKRSAAKITEDDGSNKLADNRINALQNMIKTAGYLIDSGKIDEACGQLEAAYKKIKMDGLNTPGSSSFFVKGTAASELAEDVKTLMGTLECCK